MKHRWIIVGALAACVATASCSLIFNAQGFDSCDDGACRDVFDQADGPTDARHDAADAMPETAREAASPTMPVFHYRRITSGAGDAAVSTLQPGVAFLLGSGAAHAIGCPDKGSLRYFDPSLTLGTEALSNGPYRYGQFLTASYHSPDAGLEVPPGSSRFAFTQIIPDGGDGGPDYPLRVANELTDCNGPQHAVRIDPTTEPLNPGKLHVLPRFSPDGTRVAYLNLAFPQDGGRPSVAGVRTTGVTGTSPLPLRDAPPYSPAANVVLWAVPPTWLAPISGEGGPTPTPQVAWLEGPDPSCSPGDAGCGSPPFRVNSANDDVQMKGGNLFTCAYGGGGFSQITELAFFNTTEPHTTLVALVASPGTLSVSPASASMDIYFADFFQLPYNLLDESCVVAFANATKLGPGGVARDMAVPPGGALIAYAANAAPASGSDAGALVDITSSTHIWLVPPTTDGSATPTRCSDVTDSPDFDDFGPQWFNNGHILVWTRAAHPPTAAPDSVGGLWQADVELASATCKNVRPVLRNGSTDAGTLTVMAPANTTIACSFGARGARSGRGVAVGLLLLSAVGARRRRRRRVSQDPLRRDLDPADRDLDPADPTQGPGPDEDGP